MARLFAAPASLIDGSGSGSFPFASGILKGESSFSRWDWVSFQYHRPARDQRDESCHVHEESIQVVGKLAERERARFLDPMIVGSAEAAMAQGRSLALIRPTNTRFTFKRKTAAQIAEEREAYRSAARQTDFFDKELAELEPSPFQFRFRFEDESGKHDYENGDWEAHAMFWRGRQRDGEAATLRWMDQTFNDVYPRLGMVFAIGNQAKRPKTWQLLGVIRMDEVTQPELAL